MACYLSAEFLIGPQLGNNLINLGIEDAARAGAVAARARTSTSCSRSRRSRGSATAASAGSPPAISIRWRRSSSRRIGYGIRYEFGIFDQEIRDGWQVEKTDNWLRYGNPWEIAKPDGQLPASAWAATPSTTVDDAGSDRVRWVPRRIVKGVAYDTPISGYRRQHVQHAAAVERRGRRVVRLRRLQPRRLLRRGRREGHLREPDQGALPERRARGRASACAWSSSTSSSRARCRTCCAS